MKILAIGLLLMATTACQAVGPLSTNEPVVHNMPDGVRCYTYYASSAGVAMSCIQIK